MRFIWNQRLLRALVLTVLVTNLLEAPLPIVLAVFAREEYGSAADLGLMFGALGAGALAGALGYSAVGHRLPRRRTFVTCFALVPVLYLGLATLPPLPIALAVLATAGLAAGPINPLVFTVLTEVVPKDLRGRIFGAVRAGAWASIPLGVLLGGVIVGSVRGRRDVSCDRRALLARRRVRVLQPGVSRDGPRRGGRRERARCRARRRDQRPTCGRHAGATARPRPRSRGVSVLPIGGAHAIGTYLERFGPRGLDLKVAGLCDVGEEGTFRRALERAGLGARSDSRRHGGSGLLRLRH